MLVLSVKNVYATDLRLVLRISLLLFFTGFYSSTISFAASGIHTPETSIDYTMLRLATEYNDPSAQYLVGRNYFKGKSVERNVKEAIKWFKLAAEQNHTRAMYQLGKIYLYGLGVKKDLRRAYFYLSKAVEKNHLDSQFELGNYFLKGDEKNRQYRKAIHWFRLAANRDHVRALYELGKLVYEGKGTQANPEEGRRLLTQAADNGYLEASKYLDSVDNGLADADPAHFEPEGQGTGHDPTQNASITGSPTTAAEDYQLGLAYLTGDGKNKHMEMAAEHFAKAANEGHAKAQYQLAKLYQQGIGVKQSDSSYVKWLKKSAAAGVNSAMRELDSLQLRRTLDLANADKSDPAKQYSLAMQYYRGNGDKQDFLEASKLLFKAADQNHPKAQYQLGIMYKDGKGFTRDLNKARAWFQKAADNGLPEASVALVDLKSGSKKSKKVVPATLNRKHKNGDPLESKLIPRNASPINNFLSNAKNGDRVAQYQVGIKYLKGEDGFARNVEQAVKWLQVAANNDYLEASLKLGMLYYRGVDVDKDYQTAAVWLEKAAKSGDAEAQFIMGNFYRNGLGVEKNRTAAVMWYRKAANQGHKEARMRLGGCRIC